MNDSIQIGSSGSVGLCAVARLYASVLKWLQERGATTLLRTAGAVDPISFGNVFFYANLAIGLVVLLLDRGCLKRQLPQLVLRDRSLLCLRAALGSLIGLICYFLALQRLSVISQTLLFTLILPVTALLAHSCSCEKLCPNDSGSVSRCCHCDC